MSDSPKPQPIATLRSNLSSEFERLARLHATWFALLVSLFPLVVVAETAGVYRGQPMVPVVIVSLIGTAVLARTRPGEHKRLRWFGILTLGTFLGLGWVVLVLTGRWVTSWATVSEAAALYLVSGLVAYGLVYRGVVSPLWSRLDPR